MRVSANVSYENAAKDVELFTGVKVSANTQQRLVHRSEFKRPTASSEVEELSVDGGKIRLRTQKGEPCSWRDYKGVRLHEQGTQAFFQDNSTLVDWVNHQSIAAIVTCVGDGHDGIWNIIKQLAPEKQRREILDWYHLMENLHFCRRIDSTIEKGGISALAGSSR